MAFQLFAQATAPTQPTAPVRDYNVRPIPQSEIDAMNAPSALEVALLVVAIIAGIIVFIFWVIALIHLIRNSVNRRKMWFALVILLPISGIVYFFGPRRSYKVTDDTLNDISIPSEEESTPPPVIEEKPSFETSNEVTAAPPPQPEPQRIDINAMPRARTGTTFEPQRRTFSPPETKRESEQ